MDRNLSQRIRNVEKLLSKAEEFVSLKLKKREERRAQFEEGLRPRARLHATAVAAIVMYGKPRIDEPLIRAWARTLRQHGIIVTNEYGCEYEYEHEYKFRDYGRELKIANAELYPAIMKGANESEKFTEIFSTAPIWLLEFTWMRADAELLKFDLPEMSDKQVWGEEGFKDFLRWPLLPSGMMTDGDLIPEVPPEHGVPPEHEEHSRQLRRIDEFISRRYGSERG
jgi:hypothetical protein